MPEIIDFTRTGKVDTSALVHTATTADNVQSMKDIRTYSKATAKRSINNYLKTPEEIEAELLFTAYFETDTSNVDGLSNTTKDGYFNTHSSVEGLTGTMEENY